MKNSEFPAVPSLLREINSRRVLDLLRIQGPLHAAEIARLVGLSKPSTAEILKFLVSVQLIDEATPRDQDSRRARAVYLVRADVGASLAIDIGSRFIRAAVADSVGELRSTISIELKEATLASLLKTMNKAVKGVLDDSDFELEELVSIAVGTPGIVDKNTGQIAIAGTIEDLEGIKLTEVISREFGVTPHVENDINLLAIAERENGLGKDVANFAVLSIGSGIGAGIVIDGKLHSGKNGAAGEVFYIPFGDPYDTHRTAVEPAGSGMQRIAQSLASKFPKSPIKPPFTPIALIEAARMGDDFALAVMHQVAERIALYIAAISAVIDLELIVLSGGIGRQADLFVEEVRELVAKMVPYPPRIEPTTLDANAILMGALHLANKSTFEALFQERVANTASDYEESHS